MDNFHASPRDRHLMYCSRSKQTIVKLKDASLYETIRVAFRSNHGTSEQIYHDLIVPNHVVLAKMKYYDGSCILHHALQYHVSETFILKMMETFPNWIRVRSSDGWYPFHIACRYMQSDELVVKMVETFPNAVLVDVDHEKSCQAMRIVIACSREASVLKIIELCPQVMDFPNPVGLFYLAMDANLSETVILAMLELLQKKPITREGPPDIRWALVLAFKKRHYKESTMSKMIELLSKVSIDNLDDRDDEWLDDLLLNAAGSDRYSQTFVVKFKKIINLRKKTIQAMIKSNNNKKKRKQVDG